MKIHLYLSLNPEALIASHLAPEEFGAYLAVGTQKFSRGQAMFFEVDPELQSDYPPFQNVAARCQPHLDGSPRRSTYLAIYRVLSMCRSAPSDVCIWSPMTVACSVSAPPRWPRRSTAASISTRNSAP
jgi:hypothetical protein